MTLRYWSGFSARTTSMTSLPCCSKSSCMASMKASPSLLREPLGLPSGLPDWPGLNCVCFGPVFSGSAIRAAALSA